MLSLGKATMSSESTNLCVLCVSLVCFVFVFVCTCMCICTHVLCICAVTIFIIAFTRFLLPGTGVKMAVFLTER